uniref:Cytochrome c oxidase polypeptide VIII n=1 Tax=Argas monolakensis TaxID=34602 RepID=Q09JM4_ARGMO|nr:cytochrome c oxidase polypeptide VIII [Argas monolakensis]
MNSIVQRSCTVIRNTKMQVRYRSMCRMIVTPPRVRISTAEKVGHLVALTAGILAIPAWVLVHLGDYKKK